MEDPALLWMAFERSGSPELYLRYRQTMENLTLPNLRHCLHRTTRIVRLAKVRQVGIAASATQQLLEARLQLREVEGLVREYTLTSLHSLLGAVFMGDFSKQRKAWVFDAVTTDIL